MGRVLQIPVRDVFETNAYLYFDEASGEGFLIDPGAQAERLLGVIEEQGVKVGRILLTHGHFDHMGAAEKISRELGAPCSIHEEGLRYLEDPRLNLSARNGRTVVLSQAETFREGDVLSAGSGGLSLEVIHTPGHTPDSCMLYSEADGIAFVGDTIYMGGIGLTCFPGGDRRALVRSISGKVLALPPQTLLLSGHSEPTTVGIERERFGL